MASAKQIAWRKKFAKLYGKKKTGAKSTKTKGSKSKVPKEYLDSSGKTRWQLAKIKFKGNKMGLIQYYYNIPYRMRRLYGAPKTYN